MREDGWHTNAYSRLKKYRMLSAQTKQAITQAVAVLNQGGIIAYPTEAVYGLGCDPFNEAAVKRLLAIKQRPVAKGLILLAAAWEQVALLTQPIPKALMTRVQAAWPGAVTWVFPASAAVPPWLCGQHTTIALRVTAHPLARELCQQYGKALVSTSANRANESPARDAATVEKIFGTQIDFILPGAVGELQQPTEIRDALTGQILRPG